MLDTLFSVPTVVIVDYLKMALEIFILTVVIYKTLHYLRGARGASVLAGITIALLALTWLSKQLRLDVLNWLLTGIWGTVGAAVVIIFQPELRRAFAQLGSFSFFKGKRQREVLTEIVNAATNMTMPYPGAGHKMTMKIHHVSQFASPIQSIFVPRMLLSTPASEEENTWFHMMDTATVEQI